jgi:hypothetical protein
MNPQSMSRHQGQGAFKKVSEQGRGSSPKNDGLLTKRGDEAPPHS